MDAFDDIKKDHREFMRQIDEMRGRNNARREDEMRILTESLRAHMRAEEQTIYEQLKGNEEMKNMILIQYEEHHLCDLLLDELQSVDMDNEIWNAKLSVFRQILARHIEQEEEDVFPTAMKALPDEQLSNIADSFSLIKKNITLRV